MQQQQQQQYQNQMSSGNGGLVSSSISISNGIGAYSNGSMSGGQQQGSNSHHFGPVKRGAPIEDETIKTISGIQSGSARNAGNVRSISKNHNAHNAEVPQNTNVEVMKC